MKKTPSELIKEYQAEYLRTTGREVVCNHHCGWFNIGGHKTHYRRGDFELCLNALKSRPTVQAHTEMVNDVPTIIEAHEHVVTNLMTGKQVVEDRDTPRCCSVSSEVYWAM